LELHSKQLIGFEGSLKSFGKLRQSLVFSDPGASSRLKFDWDPVKNRSNIRKHGFDFADAEEMFRGLLLIRPDTDEGYGEERWLGIGMIRNRVAFVVFAERPLNTIRIISLRKADHEEREQYKSALQDGLETN
jgi:uncharacterized protein